MRNNFYFSFKYCKIFQEKKYYNLIAIIFNLNFDSYFDILCFDILLKTQVWHKINSGVLWDASNLH